MKKNHSNNETLESGWDGYIKGKEAAPGIYVWFVEIDFADGVKKRFSGDVALIR